MSSYTVCVSLKYIIGELVTTNNSFRFYVKKGPTESNPINFGKRHQILTIHSSLVESPTKGPHPTETDNETTNTGFVSDRIVSGTPTRIYSGCPLTCKTDRLRENETYHGKRRTVDWDDSVYDLKRI